MMFIITSLGEWMAKVWENGWTNEKLARPTWNSIPREKRHKNLKKRTFFDTSLEEWNSRSDARSLSVVSFLEREEELRNKTIL